MLDPVSKGNLWMQMFKPTTKGSLGKQTCKPLDRDGGETRNCQNESRVALRGLLKNLVLVESDKPLTDYLFERGAAV